MDVFDRLMRARHRNSTPRRLRRRRAGTLAGKDQSAACLPMMVSGLLCSPQPRAWLGWAGSPYRCGITAPHRQADVSLWRRKGWWKPMVLSAAGQLFRSSPLRRLRFVVKDIHHGSIVKEEHLFSAQ